MLVLTRKAGQRIMIGDDITITLIDIKSFEKARIGIDAPDDLDIVREELLPVWRGRNSEVSNRVGSPRRLENDK